MKKYIYKIIVLLDIIAIMAVPLNLYGLSLPEIISAFLSIIIFAANIFLWFTHRKRAAKKTLTSILSLISIAIILLGSYCNPYWNSKSISGKFESTIPEGKTLTYKQAKRDLDFAMKYLKKLHPKTYDGLPEEVEALYEQAKNELMELESIDACVLCEKIERIFSAMGDAHTFVQDNYSEYRYLKYIKEHNDANERLIKINGESLETIFEKNSYKYSYDVPAYGVLCMASDTSTIQGLKYLGYDLSDGIEFTYQSPNGTENTYFYTKSDFVTAEEYYNYYGADNDTLDRDFVSYTIDEERSLAILTLNSCIYDQKYRDCVKEMFASVKEMGIKNVAVDLRDNSGGNSLVANEFLRYIDVDSYKDIGGKWRLGSFMLNLASQTIVNEKYDDTFSGDLYVITSTATFSSAMFFSQYVKDNGLGTIIGEASGNDPRNCGEVSCFTLPCSKLYMQISTKQWKRIDESCNDTLIEPDVKCDADSAIEVLYSLIG